MMTASTALLSALVSIRVGFAAVSPVLLPRTLFRGRNKGTLW
jgi:hypothetical protein